MLTTIDQFAGQDIWVYAELEYEDAYIRIEKVLDDGTVIYNAWLPSDSRAKYDLDEILYGELTGDVDSIEIHPLDTLTTEELIAKIKADGGVTASKRFTKYPQGYVKASFGINPYMKDLSDYLEYLSDDEVADLEIDTYAEPCAWMIIPDHLRDTVEKAVGLEYCSPNETYYYYIEYHPDDDSIFFGIDTDLNMETLSVSKQTEDRFKAKFKRELGI